MLRYMKIRKGKLPYDRNDWIIHPVFEKEAYTGSHHGIRYRLSKDEDTLKACVYPEPYCFEATKDEQKTWKDFEFSQGRAFRKLLPGLKNAMK